MKILMPRTATFDKAEALLKAMELFWEHGFEDTSYELLVQSTGVSRYGWYQTFGSKREIYLAALELYCERERKELYGVLMQPGAALPELLGFFQILIRTKEEWRNKGCLASRALSDWAPNDKEVADILDRSWAQIEAAFLQTLVNARHNGQVGGDVDLDASAKAFTAWLQSAGNLVRHAATHTNFGALLQIIFRSMGIDFPPEGPDRKRSKTK